MYKHVLYVVCLMYENVFIMNVLDNEIIKYVF